MQMEDLGEKFSPFLYFNTFIIIIIHITVTGFIIAILTCLPSERVYALQLKSVVSLGEHVLT
jgi:hypothetical protein